MYCIVGNYPAGEEAERKEALEDPGNGQSLARERRGQVLNYHLQYPGVDDQ